MGQKMYPLVTYWLGAGERKNSVTGKIMTLEVGPYCLIENGCAYREYTDEEVTEYVKKLHRGAVPVRIERKPRGTPSDE